MTASAPLLAAAAVAAAEQEAAGTGGNDLTLRQPPITRGLSLDFYKRSCPRAESIVRDFVQHAVRKDVGLAAGLLRLHFHDCFVQGQVRRNCSARNAGTSDGLVQTVVDAAAESLGF